MDARTETALRASIKHWEENVAAVTPKEASMHPDSCALCQMFLDDEECAGCPVAEAGYPDCRRSPWEDAFDAFISWTVAVRLESQGRGNAKTAAAPENWRKAAQAELDFLRSLLPGEPGETT